MVGYLTSDPNGTAPGAITEVDFTAALTPVHRSGEVLDFSIPGGLRIGQNTVRAVVRDYGEVGTHEVDIPLVVPAGSKLSGDVEVYGEAGGSFYDDYYLRDSSEAAQTTTQPSLLTGVPGVPAIAPSETLADLVADVNKWPVNDSLEAAFSSGGSDSAPVPVGAASEPANMPTGSITLTDATGPLYATGDIDKTSSDWHAACDAVGGRSRPQRPPHRHDRGVRCGRHQGRHLPGRQREAARTRHGTGGPAWPRHVRGQGPGQEHDDVPRRVGRLGELHRLARHLQSASGAAQVDGTGKTRDRALAGMSREGSVREVFTVQFSQR